LEELSKLGLGLAVLNTAEAKRKTRDKTMLDISLHRLKNLGGGGRRADWQEISLFILQSYYHVFGAYRPRLLERQPA
jgi:hypothetical protein